MSSELRAKNDDAGLLLTEQIPILYKYTSPEWADKMVSTGSVRVGTLHEFRKVEAVGSERVDPNEAMRIHQTDGRAAKYSHENIPNYFKEIFPQLKGDLPPGFGIILEQGARIIHHENHVDMYVYCLSSKLDDSLRQKFGGACVRINEPLVFLKEIEKQIPFFDPNGVREAYEFKLAPCEYLERAETFPRITEYDPVFRKPPQYSEECEVRGVWRSLRANETELTALKLVVPEVPEYCDRIL